jgi:hypothetical protein
LLLQQTFKGQKSCYGFVAWLRVGPATVLLQRVTALLRAQEPETAVRVALTGW